MLLRHGIMRRIATWFCLSLVVTPSWTLSQEPSGRRAGVQVTDIALNDQGVFRGQLVNDQGQPLGRSEVLLTRQGQVVGRAVTDERGEFAIAPQQAGLYQVSSATSQLNVRLWRSDIAPPGSRQELLMVESDVLRGQTPSGVYDGHLLNAFNNPWLFAGVVGAGIAVPIAISQRGDGS